MKDQNVGFFKEMDQAHSGRFADRFHIWDENFLLPPVKNTK
ncbi:hypothetical protein ACU6QD_01425 [Corynebacterium glucuronolyticum]